MSVEAVRPLALTVNGPVVSAQRGASTTVTPRAADDRVRALAVDDAARVIGGAAGRAQRAAERRGRGVMFVAVGVLTAGGVLPVAAFSASQDERVRDDHARFVQRQMMPEFSDMFAPVQPTAGRAGAADRADRRRPAVVGDDEVDRALGGDAARRVGRRADHDRPEHPVLGDGAIGDEAGAVGDLVVDAPGRAGDDRVQLVDAGEGRRARDHGRGAGQRDGDVRGAGVGRGQAPGLGAHARPASSAAGGSGPARRSSPRPR